MSFNENLHQSRLHAENSGESSRKFVSCLSSFHMLWMGLSSTAVNWIDEMSARNSELEEKKQKKKFLFFKWTVSTNFLHLHLMSAAAFQRRKFIHQLKICFSHAQHAAIFPFPQPTSIAVKTVKWKFTKLTRLQDIFFVCSMLLVAEKNKIQFFIWNFEFVFWLVNVAKEMYFCWGSSKS